MLGWIILCVIIIAAIFWRFRSRAIACGGAVCIAAGLLYMIGDTCEKGGGVDDDIITERENHIPFTRILTDDYPELEYRQIKHNFVRPTLHWGQRKLLLSEIEFLTLYGNLANTILYVGSAPGTHINYLCELFPSHKFILIDPREFEVLPHPNIEIRRIFFTNELAHEYAKNYPGNLLFVCDIRTAGHDDPDQEKKIFSDMVQQQEWVNIMQPSKSMLKFRPPFGRGTINYLAGEIRFQVWEGRSSTETRLIVTAGAPMRDYDSGKYERQLFRHNVITRLSDYNTVRGYGLDKCYDCAAEMHILREYLISNLRPHADKDLLLMSNEASRKLGDRSLMSPPHGIFADLPMNKRLQRLNRHVDKWADKQESGKNKGSYNLDDYRLERLPYSA